MNASIRPLKHWTDLQRRVRLIMPAYVVLTGWHYDTLWIDGVPAPVIASWLRPGHGLVNTPPATEQ